MLCDVKCNGISTEYNSEMRSYSWYVEGDSITLNPPRFSLAVRELLKKYHEENGIWWVPAGTACDSSRAVNVRLLPPARGTGVSGPGFKLEETM